MSASHGAVLAHVVLFGGSHARAVAAAAPSVSKI
jgi:hypothetical protein